MDVLLLALAIMVAGGLLALLAQRSFHLSTWIGAGAAVIGAIIGLPPAVRILLSGFTTAARLPWHVPYGDFHIGLDSLSAFFLVLVLIGGALVAIYGTGYLAAYRGRKSTGSTWFFFNVLLASMVLVVVSRHALLFLVAWEVMSLASFALVVFDDEHESVRRAGWLYLVATHVGTAFLIAMFPLLAGYSGSLNFATFASALPASAASMIFVLALVGFGTKAGLMPLHFWLPEAHPAAPSHVSALMSSVMIKMGIYGILRTITFLGPPPPWWGWLLIGLGLVSGILGILFAIAQHDVKRLLAYSSIENTGLITIGIGLGLLGQAYHSPAVALLGYCGALLHSLNHSLFKSLLFMAAGAVLHRTGTRNLNVLGGLLKRMPWTGTAGIVGAVAICGLPPLNGFLGELLIALGAIKGSVTLAGIQTAPTLAALAGLAVIAGLAAACFAKAVGLAFLGEPRSKEAAASHEVSWLMRAPMVALALGCFAITIFAPLVVSNVATVAKSAIPGLAAEPFEPVFAAYYALTALALLTLAMLFTVCRRFLLKSRTVAQAMTWDCGYAAPAVRMQYTASSFAQPITSFFASILRTRQRAVPPDRYFPRTGAFASETPDLFHLTLFKPAYDFVRRQIQKFRWIQHGNVHAYVLYVALAVLVVLIAVVGP